MPPKKRDKDGESSKHPRAEHIHADHELFLQAFEKPTQIYRYLRTRNMVSPIFLYRTLLYMRQRMSRSHKGRKDFKVDSLYATITAKRASPAPTPSASYMTLTFLGLYDKTVDASVQMARVEAVLLKICHKKRKDSASPVMQVSMGKADISVNPSDESPPPLSPAISIASDSFNLSNGHLVKSYILLLQAQCMPASVAAIEDAEPTAKRRRSCPTLKEDPPVSDECPKVYGAELVVYDKYNRCLLTDGDYELSVQALPMPVKASPPRKHSSWESLNDAADSLGLYDVFEKGPVLKFKLRWAQEASRPLVDRPRLYTPAGTLPLQDNKENVPAAPNHNNNNNNNNNNNVSTMKGAARLQIVYQFLYNNNSRQQTEACEDLHCPWCSVNCLVLYALLKHLKLCHSRFSFTYVPIAGGARIDVAINELYDGSYTGSPHDLVSQPGGGAFARSGPVRRASVTHVLVCRPKRAKPSLHEFLELDEPEFDGRRPFITGHNRLYHHTTTCLPILPKEMEQDSEAEHDPEWLQTKTKMMIDEFTDVNEGEKELMKMWNLHVMKQGYVGDCQIPLACTMFLQARGKDLLMRNLYRNFVLHMCSLFDFGLISPVTMFNTIKRLQDLAGETGAIRKVLRDAHDKQMDNWVRTGVFQQPAQERANAKNQTPATSRTPKPGQPRRKGTPSVELRRKSQADVPSRKRLSLALKKDEANTGTAIANGTTTATSTQGKPVSS